jgi:hypothetical protein
MALLMAYTGMPDDQIDGMRQAAFWPQFEAIAPMLAYDHVAIVGETVGVRVDLASQVTVPTLVMSGGASYPFVHATAQALSEAIPHA